MGARRSAGLRAARRNARRRRTAAAARGSVVEVAEVVRLGLDQGAVTMATEALSQGDNIQVQGMANDVIAQQTAEIDRMRSM
ncbi:DUF305 domain-containing protein [Streptomyces sp. HMX112]|uniref:DUF305 domain-containing protein n=1 Tax=Streptomyces sp. HMX112 TaxID=3390850 RepID=UPI003A800CA4